RASRSQPLVGGSRSDLRVDLDDSRHTAVEAGSYPRRRWPLYRFCVFVLCITQFSQPRRDGSEITHGHVFWHPPHRRSCFYSRTACRCCCSFTFLPMATRYGCFSRQTSEGVRYLSCP